ncbi:MAG: UbiA family prenyltransferase [Candidatus Aenigmarchaeota archaeon]|nr:UbiA family prenyltransferase [Candidatus Aenigmarchaeota archaeon]
MVKHFLELMRPLNGFMAALAVFIGAYIVAGSSVIMNINVYLAIVVTFLISGGGMAINDYYDRHIDTLNKPHRPIPSGRISINAALVFSLALFAIGIYISFFINLYCLLLALINSILLVLYSYHFKKVIIIGHVIISYLVASSFLFGGLVVYNLGNLLGLLILCLLAFLANLSREIMKTIEDMRADRIGKVKSIPIVYGEKIARKVSSVLLSFAIILAPLPYLLNVLDEVYLVVVSIGVVLFIFSVIWNERETPAKKVHKLMKYAMLVSLLAFLLGAIF